MIAMLRHGTALALADVRDEMPMERGELRILIMAGAAAAALAMVDRLIMRGNKTR
jgi:hypothetical protein